MPETEGKRIPDDNTKKQDGEPTTQQLVVKPDHSWPATNFSIPGRPALATVHANPQVTGEEGALIILELYPGTTRDKENQHKEQKTTTVLLNIPKAQMAEIRHLYKINEEALKACRGLAGMISGLPSMNIVALPTGDTGDPQAQQPQKTDLDDYNAEMVLIRCSWCQAPTLSITLKPRDEWSTLPRLHARQLHMPEVFNGKTNLVIDPACLLLVSKAVEEEMRLGIGMQIPGKSLRAAIRKANSRTTNAKCMVELENFQTALRKKQLLEKNCAKSII